MTGYTVTLSGVDPGFPIGGGANPGVGVGKESGNIRFLPKFLKNCVKLRKFLVVGRISFTLHPPMYLEY